MGRKSKGQTEIVLVLAVVIILVVVVLFATNRPQLPPEPESVSQLKAQLKSDIEREILSQSFSVIQTVAQNGGYYDLQKSGVPSLGYLGQQISYWQYGGETSFSMDRSKVGNEIGTGVKEALKNLDVNSFKSVEGKNLQASGVQSVSAEIKNENVVVKVNMPVALEGYPIAQPFEVNVPIKLGEALDFANELVSKNAQERYFERFAKDSILMYQIDDEFGNPRVPSVGILSGCGNSFFRSWWNVKPEMEGLIAGMLGNVHTAGRSVLGSDNTSHYPSYALPVYTDLDAEFVLGEPLNQNNFQMYPNPVRVATENPAFVSVCFSKPYKIDYVLLYPVVAEVSDGDNFKLRFAMHSFLRGYEPGDFADTGLVINYYKENVELCQQALCQAKITVSDVNGPVQYADVAFHQCSLGQTDADGVVEGKIPCVASELDIYSDQHTPYNRLLGATELEEFSVNLGRVPVRRFHFYNIDFSKQGEIYTVNDVLLNDKKLTLTAKPLDDESSIGIPLQTNGTAIVTEAIPSGVNGFSIVVQSDSGGYLGGFYDVLDFGEVDEDLYVYVPILQGGLTEVGATVEEKLNNYAWETTLLLNKTLECAKATGLSIPISPGEISNQGLTSIKGCVV